MSLQTWQADGRLRPHVGSAQETADLLRVVERDLADAGIQVLSSDRRFTTAYNAALQLATIVLRASGYRTAGVGHHWITFQALPELMGAGQQVRADYFDACRRKRNIADYDAAGEISDSETEELLAEALEFRRDVQAWLSARR
jgi:hypothetical protein